MRTVTRGLGRAAAKEPSSSGGRPLAERAGAWLVVACALLLLPAGCRRGASERSAGPTEEAGGGGEVQAPAERPLDLPRVLVVGPGSGPALYLGPERDDAAVGYLNPGVRVRLESGVVNDRVEALIAGPMPAKGWLPVDRLAAYAQHRGRVEGTRAYLGPNDLVQVLGSAGDGQMRVSVQPWFGNGHFLGPFVGTFPREHLAAQPVDEGEVEGVSEGECYQLPAGQTVTLYERPNGEPVATLPALVPPATVVVLRQRGDVYGVRAGYGPYLTGYVQQSLTPCEGARPPPDPMVPQSDTERPYWMSQESGPLHRVAEGTSVRFHGETIARLRTEGWARELGRQDGDMVDVFVAADEGVAVRGLVPADSLTLVEGAPAAPAAAPAEEEELPPELQ